MNWVSFLMFLFLGSTAFAIDCADFAGQYKVKVREAMVGLEISQSNCERFDFRFVYPSGSEIKRSYVPDSQLKIVFDDGVTTIYEAAKLHKVDTGRSEWSLALQVTQVRYDLLSDTKVTSESEYYVEKSSYGKGLVERRDLFDQYGDRAGRIYLGYVEDKGG